VYVLVCTIYLKNTVIIIIIIMTIWVSSSSLQQDMREECLPPQYADLHNLMFGLYIAVLKSQNLMQDRDLQYVISRL